MTEEEIIQTDLIKKFNILENKIKIQRQRRIFAEVNDSDFDIVFNYIVSRLEFSVLCAITGIDLENSFGVIYHLGNKNNIVFSLKRILPRDNPSVKTVTNVFAGAEIYEREMMDLVGINVSGLAEGKRYPLPDDWPKDQFPLRKDWKSDDMVKGEQKQTEDK